MIIKNPLRSLIKNKKNKMKFTNHKIPKIINNLKPQKDFIVVNKNKMKK